MPVEEVPYDAVHELRVAWHREDFPDQDPSAYHAQAREVALRRDVQVLAVRERGAPVAFAQLERDGAAAEITQVYVHPEHRGGGRGTAMTRAAIEAAGDVRDLWIAADDDDRPRSSTHASASARHGRRWSSCGCRESRPARGRGLPGAPERAQEPPAAACSSDRSLRDELELEPPVVAQIGPRPAPGRGRRGSSP